MSEHQVSGNPSDEESAAVAAVVAHMLAEQAEVFSAPPPRPRQSDWVLAWRPQVRPLRSQPPRPAAARGNDETPE